MRQLLLITKVSGWDTHQNQGGVNGELANRLHDFDVLGEVVTRALSAEDLNAVFPGAQLNHSGFLRIV